MQIDQGNGEIMLLYRRLQIEFIYIIVQFSVRFNFTEFEAKICLITSFRDTCYIEIIPKDKNPTRELWLSFWSEVHYNSLYATGDVPARKPRRKHWLF
ncbi:hypothetical protein Patl1_33249 [Pistacia atlantica]|uniref:Uncharacterized protein n=1 Tax=Pistacia atlantica TaxID=434234 RepID=A0ACC1AN23_9ROSI|nr:hypothetical protein Patl1_33249 [Pistacia atlantica]